MLGVIASRHRQQVETAFVSTWNVATDNEIVTLPVTKDYTVDWGDGTTTTTGNSHTYTTSGTYQIKMYGVVDDFVFNFNNVDPNQQKIISIDNWGGFVLGLNTGEFNWCRNLTSIPNNYKKTTNTQWGNVFRFCDVLDFDFLNFANQNITTLSNTFVFTKQLTNQDLSFIDSSNCSRFTSCFNSSNYNGDSSWINTDNCLYFNGVFSANTQFNQPLNHLNTSKVLEFTSCFSNATSFNQDVSSWNFSKR